MNGPLAPEAVRVLAEKGCGGGQVPLELPLRQQPRILLPVPPEAGEPHGHCPEAGAQFNDKYDTGLNSIRVQHINNKRKAV